MMMTMTSTDTIVADYLDTLRAELATVPEAVANEVLDDISEHIAGARADLPTETEAAVRDILHRLGPPAAIAAAAREGQPVRPMAAPGLVEYLVFAALVVGPFVIPVLLPVLGAVLASYSRWWTRGEKTFAWCMTLLPLVVTAAVGAAAALADVYKAVWVLGIVGLGGITVGPLVAAVVLFVRLKRRRRLGQQPSA
jgi:uncharacterized membrane protein